MIPFIWALISMLQSDRRQENQKLNTSRLSNTDVAMQVSQQAYDVKTYVVSTSMRRHDDVASTLIRRCFTFVCLLGNGTDLTTMNYT